MEAACCGHGDRLRHKEIPRGRDSCPMSPPLPPGRYADSCASLALWTMKYVNECTEHTAIRSCGVETEYPYPLVLVGEVVQDLCGLLEHRAVSSGLLRSDRVPRR